MPDRPERFKPWPTRPGQVQTPVRRPRTGHRKLYDRRAYRDKFCPRVLIERPTCEDCQALPAKHVHHKRKLAEHPEDLLDPAQVLALCHGCHSVRTAKGE